MVIGVKDEFVGLRDVRVSGQTGPDSRLCANRLQRHRQEQTHHELYGGCVQ